MASAAALSVDGGPRLTDVQLAMDDETCPAVSKQGIGSSVVMPNQTLIHVLDPYVGDPNCTYNYEFNFFCILVYF
jgi:hypothetical protein